jgi:hypothetical protein
VAGCFVDVEVSLKPWHIFLDQIQATSRRTLVDKVKPEQCTLLDRLLPVFYSQSDIFA